MDYSVFDIEANGLNPDVIWCLSIAKYRDDKVVSRMSYTNYDDMKKAILEEKILVGHNIKRYDIPVMERILGIKIDALAIDTLPISWYLYPYFEVHGLDEWGERLGIKKPKITDGEWLGPLEGETEEQFLQKMVNRCQEDTKINIKLWNKVRLYLDELYEGDFMPFLRYLEFKMDCAREQEEIKWRLDQDFCRNTLSMFEEEYEKRYKRLQDEMPENVKYRKKYPPKNMKKQDGTWNKHAENWFELLDELGLDRSYKDYIKIEQKREIGNPNSTDQIKAWLYELGWEPQTFKFYKNKETGAVSKVEQISLPFGAGICPSVKKLYEVEPRLENLEMFYVIKHRIGVLQGFLDNVDEEGYLKAEISGLTNTLRFKHKTIVNLPGYTGKHTPEKPNWKDGVHIRGCLIAPEGHVLMGSDMSSLEDRTKQHYMYFFDPEYVESMMKPDFDPHLDLAQFAYEEIDPELGLSPDKVNFYKAFDQLKEEDVTPELKTLFNQIKKIRSEFKTVNYAATYGSGADTMSKNSGMSVEKCVVLIKAYWKKNWALKKIAMWVTVKEVNRQRWLYNPLSGFWYSLRSSKDKFSTLNQGTGVYCFDQWVRGCRSRGVKTCGQFHDEIIAPCKNDEQSKKEMETKLRDSISDVNARLKMNRDLDIDVQFGDNYAQIH